MRAFVVAAALCVTLAAAPTFAQAPAAAPAAPAPAAQAASAEPAFPAGAKYAFVNIQRIAAESAQGKVLSARVKALQASQQKLDSGGSVLSDAARAQLAKDIDRQQTEIQRFTDDAQKEVQDMQNELQAEFQQKLGPVIQQIAQEKKLEIQFSALDAGIIWADAGLDLTSEVIRRFDVAAPVAAAPAAAPPRAAAPAPAPAPRAAAPAAPRPAAPAA